MKSAQKIVMKMTENTASEEDLDQLRNHGHYDMLTRIETGTVLRSRLSEQAKLLWFLFKTTGDHRQRSKVMYWADVAEAIGSSERSVRRWANELEKARFLKIVRRKDERGYNFPNEFTATLPKESVEGFSERKDLHRKVYSMYTSATEKSKVEKQQADVGDTLPPSSEDQDQINVSNRPDPIDRDAAQSAEVVDIETGEIKRIEKQVEITGVVRESMSGDEMVRIAEGVGIDVNGRKLLERARSGIREGRLEILCDTVALVEHLLMKHPGLREALKKEAGCSHVTVVSAVTSSTKMPRREQRICQVHGGGAQRPESGPSEDIKREIAVVKQTLDSRFKHWPYARSRDQVATEIVWSLHNQPNLRLKTSKEEAFRMVLSLVERQRFETPYGYAKMVAEGRGWGNKK